MIPEIGHAALILAMVLACWQMLALPFAKIVHEPVFAACVRPLALSVFLLVTLGFACLMVSYARSDFSVLNVIENSHSLKPFWYKLTGTWGNHEGSMLLWLWVLSFYGALAAYIPTREETLRRTALMVVGGITALFSAFLLLTSNPFVRIFPPPADGQDLNPLLQDIGLILHPPVLYLGYVGAAIVFAYAIAAMWQQRVDRHFATAIKPWVMMCWLSLTAGIGLGSWWAYRELGWGGWWFWDPVENVALLPWLCATALMHSSLMLQRRGNFPYFTAFLALLTFSMSLIGTFIVRSGLITSVHAFASASDRGIFMLVMVCIIILVGAFAFARVRLLAPPPAYAVASRQGMVMVAGILLLSLAATVLLAILYPLILTLTGQNSISVGAPYFEAVFIPTVLPLGILAAMAPLTLWDHARRVQLLQLLYRLLPALVAAAMVAIYIFNPRSIMAIVAFSIAIMLFVSLVFYIRKPNFTLQNAATCIGHAGFALMLLTVTLNTQFSSQAEAPMKLGETRDMAGYSLSLREVKLVAHQNYFARRAMVELRKSGKLLAELMPETRYYPVRGQETTESAIHSNWLRDVYVVIGRVTYQPESTALQEAQKIPAFVGVRVYVMPAQRLIWLGFLLAVLSGIVGIVAHIRKQRGHAQAVDKR